MRRCRPAGRFYGDQKIFEVFAERREIDTDFTWGPTMTDTYPELTDGFAKAVNGNASLPEALAAAQQETVAEMKQQGLVVAE